MLGRNILLAVPKTALYDSTRGDYRGVTTRQRRQWRLIRTSVKISLGLSQSHLLREEPSSVSTGASKGPPSKYKTGWVATAIQNDAREPQKRLQED